MKDLIKITLGLLAAILIAGLGLYSFKLFRNEDRQTLEYANTALYFQQDERFCELFDQVGELVPIVGTAEFEDTEAFTNELYDLQLKASNYRYQLNYIYPTTESLDLQSSLIREAGLISEACGSLNRAWQARLEGRTDEMSSYLEEAGAKFESATQARQQNYEGLVKLRDKYDR